MTRLLIAGYGFLGVALKEEFAAAGWEVTTLGRSQEADICCDLTSHEQVMAIPGDYDLVIQCAASGGGGEEAYRAIYLNASQNLLGRFSGVGLIFVSSTSVYAQTDHAEVSEGSPAEPTTATGKILRQAEVNVLGMGGSVARLSGLYGPGRCHILKGLLKGTARLDGDGRRVMNFIHRDDAASALRLMAEAPVNGGIYNISAGAESQRECYQSLADHFALPLPASATSDAPRKRGNSSKRVSSSLIRNLGWQPKYPDFLSLARACAEEVGE